MPAFHGAQPSRAKAVQPDVPAAAPGLVPPPSAGTARDIEQQLEAFVSEVAALRRELADLRQRDETINRYIHRLDEELRLAARLQRDFLPKTLPQLGRVRFHSLFRPAGYVSGDIYDVMRLDERRVGFYLADAIGHGVPAALLTMFVKHALQTKDISPSGDSYRLLDPGESLRRLNARLIEQNLSYATFATALYGTIDINTLQVIISRAGHPCPILLRAGGRVESIDANGSLLGIFPDETYDSRTLQLNPGDRLVLHTDGLEVGLPDGEGRLWREILCHHAGSGTSDFLEKLTERLDCQSGSVSPKDDLTIVVVEAAV